MQLKIIRTEKPTDDSVSIYFERNGPLKFFKAGQYGNFSFLINGSFYSRTYSFHTSPDDHEIGITVRAVNEGLVSNFLQSANGACNIHLNAIGGDFYFEPSKDIKRHLIMFAAGSGITPIFSIIQAVLQQEPRSTVSLVYSNKRYARIIFKKELHALETRFEGRLKVHHVISQDNDIPPDFPVFYKGRLTPLITKKTIKAIRAQVDYQVEYYMCGPNAMMDVIASTIRSIGPGRPTVNREVFYVPSRKNDLDVNSLPDREIIVQVRDEEKLVIVKSGQSILQAALAQGINLPFSCTEGQCGVCRASVMSGEVKLQKNHILTDEELNAGQVLLCQGFPFSEGISIKTTL